MAAIPLTDLIALREIARREAGPFVDPARLRRFLDVYRSYPAGWVYTILGLPLPEGGPVQSPPASTVRWHAMVTLLKAADLDPDFETRDPAIAAAEAAEAAAHDARRVQEAADQERARTQDAAKFQAWAALRARLPVPVFVGHNWSIGHYDGYVTGRDHIIVQEHLAVGRLVRRKYWALCETDSIARRGRLDPLRALDRDPETAHDPDDTRTPTCKACLKVAERVAG